MATSSPSRPCKDYAGKPRPVVVVQDNNFDTTDLSTICAFTSNEAEAPLFRLPVAPNDRNALRAPCRLMVNKITTVPKSKIGARIGPSTTRTSCASTRRCSSFSG